MTTGSEGQIMTGAEVFGADNERIGKITEAGEHYFLVQHGFLFHKALYLPMRTVARVDAHRVYLNVPKYEAEAMATEHLPAAGDAWYGHEETLDDPTDAPDETNETDTVSVMNQAVISDSQEPVAEMSIAETLPADPAEGDVSSPRDVGETITEPTPREDLHLLDRTVEIPLREQEVVIEKTAVVTSEISIRRETVTGMQHVTDTVRREAARVEATDGARVHTGGESANAGRNGDAATSYDDHTRYERMTEAERADYDRRSEKK